MDVDSFEVVIKHSKTDPFRRGCHLANGSSRNKLCPVLAMNTYMLQSTSGTAARPLFEFTSGARPTRAALTSYLRCLLQQQGLDETLYASHSLELVLLQQPDQQVCQHGSLKLLAVQTVMNGILEHLKTF